MLSLLRQRNIGLFWLGTVISQVGDMVLLVALPYYVYDLTGSTLQTGAMFIAYTLPRLLFSSLAGVWVDRWDRKRIMVVSDLLRAVSLLILLFSGGSTGTLWVVYVVFFFQSAIGQLFIPAKNALIPHLVEDQDLVAANALDSLSSSVTRLVGPSLGGVLMGLVGLTSVVVVDSVSFLFSAIAIMLITVPADSFEEKPKRTKSSLSDNWKKIWKEWLEGIMMVKSNREVAAVFIGVNLVMIGYGITSVLLVVFVRELLGGGALEFGWLMTAQGIGSLIGGFLIGQKGKILRPARLFPLALGGTGIAFLVAFNIHHLISAILFISLAGLAMTGWIICERTLLQRNVSDRYRGRVFGVYATANSILMLVGMGLASTLGKNILPMLNIAGASYLISGSISFLILGSASKQKSSIDSELEQH